MSQLNGTRQYKTIFFDLDHTLWDYETNSRQTLDELYIAYNLQERGITDFDTFLLCFKSVNTKLWDLYDRGEIDSQTIRRERFKQILEHFHAYEEKLSQNLSVDYLYLCPQKGNLMPYALETLQYLSRHYAMTIVTNGFEEIQNTKLNSGKLRHFFNHIVTSQKAGFKKPAREIFDYAMKVNSTACSDVIMIGDNLITDMGGARNASIDTVFFNPDKIVHETIVKHEISCLSELQKIL
ncbi:MAG: YjjG family noncanonical pyrimidine nucleotidase [Bacteroidota bacterium]